MGMARPSLLGFSTVDKGRQGGFPEAAGAQGTDLPHAHSNGPGWGHSHQTPAQVLPLPAPGSPSTRV